MRIGVLVLTVGLLLGCQAKINQNKMDLGDGFSVYDPNVLSDLLENTKISESQRHSSIDSLRSAFKGTYVGYELKKSLIGKSGDEIFDECLQDTTTQPMTSVEFYDEVKKCLARFKDTHIIVTRYVPSTMITTGIAMAGWIGDKLTIFLARPQLLAKFEELAGVPAGTYTNVIKKGAWIEEIDGRPAIEAVHDLETYVSASTPLASKTEATELLFTRNFRYPKSTTVDLKIRLNDGSEFKATLPWVLRSETGGLESQADLIKKGFTPTNKLDKNSLLNTKGYAPQYEIFWSLDNRHEYYSTKSTNDWPTLVTGFASVENKQVCYLQVSSFSLKPGENAPRYPVYEANNDAFLESGFIDVVKNHLKTCQSFKAPLILDIRENSGGSANLASEMFALFERPEVPQTYMSYAYTAAPGNLPVLLSLLSDLDPTKTVVETELILTAQHEANLSKAPVTSWIASRMLTMETNVFTGKILVLISPSCISACDITAKRFKSTGLGVLVGEATNGTGFGFLGYKDGDAFFRDPYNMYQVRIPNFAFQVLTPNADTSIQEDQEQRGFLLPLGKVSLLENNPTVPDVEIHTTYMDLFGHEDYIKSLAPLL